MVYGPKGCVVDTDPCRQRRNSSIDIGIARDILDFLLVQRREPIIRRGKLTFTIGMQRSGKSTWATRWSQFLEDWKPGDEFFPRAIVCSDNIRLALHGQRYNRKSEVMVWAINGYMVESLLGRGHDVLIDGTNTTERSIRRILEIDNTATYKLIDTPKEVCIQRAYDDDQPDLVYKGVIERVHGQLEALKAYGIDQKIAEIREDINRRCSNGNDTINNAQSSSPPAR